MTDLPTWVETPATKAFYRLCESVSAAGINPRSLANEAITELVTLLLAEHEKVEQARTLYHKAVDDRFRALDMARARGTQRDEYQQLYAAEHEARKRAEKDPAYVREVEAHVRTMMRAEQAEERLGAAREMYGEMKERAEQAEAALAAATHGMVTQELAEKVQGELAAMTAERDKWKMLFSGACGNEDDAEDRAEGRLRTIKELRSDLAAARAEVERWENVAREMADIYSGADMGAANLEATMIRHGVTTSRYSPKPCDEGCDGEAGA